MNPHPSPSFLAQLRAATAAQLARLEADRLRVEEDRRLLREVHAALRGGTIPTAPTPPPLEAALADVVRRAAETAVGDAHARAPSKPGSEFLCFDAAAARCGVSKSTVKRWVEAGRLRTYGTGRAVRLRTVEIDALMRDVCPEVDRAADGILSKMRRAGPSGE